MLWAGATRSVSRSVLRPQAILSRPQSTSISRTSPWGSKSLRNRPVLAITAYKHAPAALVRYQSGMVGHIDKNHEAENQHQLLKPHPERVSTESSVHPITHEIGVANEEEDVDMLKGIKSDIRTIRETFNLKEVPKEAMAIGLAGVLPYVATSLSTIYLAWDLNHAASHGVGVLLNAETAQHMLAILEPLQIGYGAVIISFLGAIHWGLEWARYGGKSYPFQRYAPGVIAPAIAWPTIFMPVEYALIAQFMAFNLFYFNDARAATLNRAPYWYGIYRFALTFIVGASIVASLIGRGQIVEYTSHPSHFSEQLQALRESQEYYLELEEKERRERMAREEEEGEDEQEEGAEEEEESSGDE